MNVPYNYVVNLYTTNKISGFSIRGIFRIMSNIYDGGFLRK